MPSNAVGVVPKVVTSALPAVQKSFLKDHTYIYPFLTFLTSDVAFFDMHFRVYSSHRWQNTSIHISHLNYISITKLFPLISTLILKFALESLGYSHRVLRFETKQF